MSGEDHLQKSATKQIEAECKDNDESGEDLLLESSVVKVDSVNTTTDQRRKDTRKNDPPGLLEQLDQQDDEERNQSRRAVHEKMKEFLTGSERDIAIKLEGDTSDTTTNRNQRQEQRQEPQYVTADDPHPSPDTNVATPDLSPPEDSIATPYGAFAASVVHAEGGELRINVEPRPRNSFGYVPKVRRGWRHSSGADLEQEEERAAALHLMEAQPVDVAEAQPVDVEAATKRRRQRNAAIWKMLLVLSLFMAAGVFLVIFKFVAGDKDEYTININSTEAPTILTEELIFSVLPEFTKTAMKAGSFSAQSRAFDWLKEDPNLGSYTVSRMLQRFSLATLYFSTDGPHWDQNHGWLSYSLHECHWTFVLPNGIGYGEYEQQLESPCESTNGNHSRGGSDFYTHLRLFKNNLQGTLPPELSFLSHSLLTINLDENNLVGTLSSQISQLTQLEYLSVSINSMSGSLPTHIGSMPVLRELYLDTNLFSGPLPVEIAKMESLEWLWMFRNLLTGALPRTWGTHIADIVLFDNQITSTLPTTLGNLTSIIYLLLDTNRLSGTLPSELGHLWQTQRLHLNSNLLTGTIPTEIGQLTSLEYWNRDNSFETEWLPHRTSELHLQSNSLVGTLPSELGLLHRFHSLNFADNQLTGDLPQELGSLLTNGSLAFLDVKNTSLSGTIPQGLCALNDLLLFDCGDLLCGCNCECNLSVQRKQIVP